MLVQALAAYADANLHLEMGDPAFERKPVPLMLEISGEGRFLRWIPREESVMLGKKAVKRTPPHEVPRSPVNRNSGEHPLLGFDDAKYVLGPGKKHEAFVSLLDTAARTTGDEAMAACVRFYEQPEEVARARAGFDEKVTGGILLSVSPEGPVILIDRVKDFWREHYRRAYGERNEAGGEGMCLVSGRQGSIAPTHDKIKGTASLGGQASGVSLMSFDKDAFQSYGWERNANSPVSPGRAQAYVMALNHLLAGGEKSRVNRNGTGFLFWLRKPAPEFDPMNFLEKADPDAVRNLLELRAKGWRGIEANDFYLLAVCGNGGRLQVRQWIHESLETTLANVAAWFDGLRIIDVFNGEIAPAPKMWQLVDSLARDEPPPGRAVELMRRALHGDPLGLSMLGAALGRMRVEQGKDRLKAVRAGLIRLLVNDEIGRDGKGEQTMGAELNEAESHPAYLCGRLLAMFDGLQYAASGSNLNQTVADRYYTLASTYPQLAFP